MTDPRPSDHSPAPGDVAAYYTARIAADVRTIKNLLIAAAVLVVIGAVLWALAFLADSSEAYGAASAPAVVEAVDQ